MAITVTSQLKHLRIPSRKVRFVADVAKSKAFYKAALKAGGEDNGKPGIRTDYTQPYYAAFVVDPDGYRLEAYCNKKA